MKKEGNESYQHILKYTGIFGGVQGLNIVLGLVRALCLRLPIWVSRSVPSDISRRFMTQATRLRWSIS